MGRVPLFPGEARPLLFAHRGVSARAPENTMAAFALARSSGVPGLELDIHLAESGELVVIHDEDALRTCAQPLRIENARLEEIRRLDAGAWKGSEWIGERIPLLAEVFEEFSADFYFDIEIKSKTAADRGLEAALARLLRDFAMGERAAVSSFNPLSLARFKALAPQVPTAAIWCREPDMPWYLRRGEGRWISRCDYLKPAKALVRSRQANRTLVAWTVDTPEEADRLLALGCAGLVSNDPSALRLSE